MSEFELLEAILGFWIFGINTIECTLPKRFIQQSALSSGYDSNYKNQVMALTNNSITSTRQAINNPVMEMAVTFMHAFLLFDSSNNRIGPRYSHFERPHYCHKDYIIHARIQQLLWKDQNQF